MSATGQKARGAHPTSAPSGQSRATDGVIKAVAYGPGVLFGLIVVAALVGLLPAPWDALVGWSAAALTVLLISGLGEGLVCRLMLRARPLDPSDPQDEARRLACSLRRAGAIPAKVWSSPHLAQSEVRPFGRHTVLISQEVIDHPVTRSVAETVRWIEHAEEVLGAGLTRNDTAIVVWSTPCRVLTRRWPRRGLLGFAWRVRPVIFSLASWSALAADEGATPEGSGAVVAVIVLVLLGLTYLVPAAQASWDKRLGIEVRSTSEP